jgi:hypothetical protein
MVRDSERTTLAYHRLSRLKIEFFRDAPESLGSCESRKYDNEYPPRPISPDADCVAWPADSRRRYSSSIAAVAVGFVTDRFDVLFHVVPIA